MNLPRFKFPLFLVICLLLGLTSTSIQAQDTQEDRQVKAGVPQPSFWSQLRYGGGIGLSFGSGYFSGTLAPAAIYPFNRKFAAGVGLNFTYEDFSDNYSSTVVGGSLLGLYNPIPELQLSAEFEQLYVDRSYDDRIPLADESYWYPGLFLGVGYGSRNVSVGIRYDVLYNSRRSIYNNAWVPFVRVFF